MARSLEEILQELKEAEKEYAEKCKKYGIEEKHRKKKEEVQLDENGNPIVAQVDENVIAETKEETNNENGN